MAHTSTLSRLTSEESTTEQPYRNLVGSLMYIMTSTRPDLAVPVSQLGQYMARPGPAHWNAAKRVVRYLKGTDDLGLCFSKDASINPSNVIVAYSDADWGTDTDDRKSYTGYAVFLGNSLVSWKCKKQTAVALSTAEAEYMAVSMTALEVIWLRNVLSDLGLPQQGPSVIYCDNRSCIHMANNDSTGPRTKHIAIKYHFIKDQIAAGNIVLQYVPSIDNIADFLTKPLVGERFVRMREELLLRRTTGV